MKANESTSLVNVASFGGYVVAQFRFCVLHKLAHTWRQFSRSLSILTIVCLAVATDSSIAFDRTAHIRFKSVVTFYFI